MSTTSKMAIVVRKDFLNKKITTSSIAARASILWLTENDDSERFNCISLSLSPLEHNWLYSKILPEVYYCSSEDELVQLHMTVQLRGIEAHVLTTEEKVPIALAIGPDAENIVSAIVSHLKLV